VQEAIRLLSSLLPIIFFVIFCKRKASKELWVFFVYCIISLIFDVFLAVSAWAFDHRFSVWNFYGILEIGVLSYFFYLIINQRVIKVLILLSSILYIIFSLIYFQIYNDYYNSIMSTIGSVILLILALCYFLNTMKPTAEPVNIFTPVFLIVIALLVNISSTLFLIAITNRMTVGEMTKYWGISNYAIILMNLTVSAAFILFHYQKKSKPPESHTVDFTSRNDR